MGGCSAPNCRNHSNKGFKMYNVKRDKCLQDIWIQNMRRADWAWYPPQNITNCQLCEVKCGSVFTILKQKLSYVL